ncbi:hypothetical protein ID0464_13220 [Helicobacter pylori]
MCVCGCFDTYEQQNVARLFKTKKRIFGETAMKGVDIIKRYCSYNDKKFSKDEWAIKKIVIEFFKFFF